MKDFINVGLLGAGTVGGGVIKVLEKNAAAITQKVGKPIRITKILDRNVEARQKEFGDQYIFTDAPEEVLNDKDIDIIVELLGREHPAKEYIAQAFENGKHVVTANKDVLARYGSELFPLAEKHHCDFMFEASVCGGIPIIEPLKTSMAANTIHSVMGIVNGTTNYMLTKMSNEHLEYEDVLKEAQEKGYAESDPTADVGGLDAARKIVILASIAFNTRISLDDVLVEGIESIEASDIKYAQNLGYAIKLLAIAKNDPENGVMACVKPTMLPLSHPLAGVNGVYNAVFVNGDAIGEAMFLGLGAGRLPTASSVCGDIIEIARNMQYHSNGRISCTCFKEKKLCPPEKMSAPAYIRLQVLDQPGALAAIAAAFGAQNVSLRNVLQTNGVLGQKAEVVVVTHSVSESNLQMALQILQVLPVVEKVSCVIRVEDSSLS
ncbi:MAG: homoserine dehydrogenase [Phascolarctobacterium sp.]|uniref:homoserine dehydrogenase n=1 Tax=Phascolarctobacterium sp. TaxID=2049039 RepID=UPI0026DC5D43|nr:homoserine dehydrogenase [Phascolarctobacterium sp.]MDO4921059.1 homoserine dehydrogenase [Phascolarctobacterium sp.]